jgi:simple sugar transport system substrate-binding protein
MTFSSPRTRLRRPSRARLSVVSVSLLALLTAACSQSNSASSSGGSSSGGTNASAAAATGAKPAPFSQGTVKIALVRQSGAGDFFEQWGSGAQAQAKALGIDLTVYDAQADNAKQATDLSTAISSGVSAIIVDHGFAATVDPLINQAVAKGIKVVTFDVDSSNAKVVSTEQSDADLAKNVLDVAEQQLGKSAKVGYVNVAGYPALDARDTVWQQVKTGEGWSQEFKVGEVTDSTATDNVPLVGAALLQHSNVAAVFAPYDELAKATVVAVQNDNLAGKVKVYGIDISNADIQILTENNSPWVATAGTDPSSVGAAVVRTTALELAGQLGKTKVAFPGVAITRQFLLDHKIKNMDQLRAAIPALNLGDISTANWMPVVSH